jgi:NCS1 family nucleobase:cation symporter-1
VALVGLVVEPLRWLYNYAWFVGFVVSGALYAGLMKTAATANAPKEAYAHGK